MSKDFEIVPLFVTPVILVDVPDAAALNADLRNVIEQREKSHPGGKRTSDKIMGVLAANKGTADIHLIKDKLKLATGNVSPTLTDMIAHKEIVRVEPGVYRVNG